MLTLDGKIKFDQKAIDSPNLCDRFDRDDLDRIGAWAYDNFVRDKATRVDWEKRSEAGINLAMQLQKEKTFPWPNCSNIAFPLVTIAALQFHARAYPAIVNGRSVVQCRVVGPDPEGVAAARAKRIGEHMSWQCLEQDEGWEEDTDRGLLNVSIVGVGWKKSYFNASLGHNTSEFVAAKDLVVSYWAKSIETASCKTHILPMYKNDIHERVMRGAYRDCTEEGWYKDYATNMGTQRTPDQDARAGQEATTNTEDAPFTMLEQHCWLDLDDDGYDEPYIITFEESSQFVVRIVARVNRIEDVEFNDRKQIVKITAMEYFTKIPFIPSPDGGIMDIGFGVLLGPLNESVNTSINQLFDAGTVNNTAGGFLGRGAKIRGGVYEFKPFGWHRVDATGDDLRKSVFPLPVREPSAVMFNLLSLLIDYTSRISGATDMLVGENPGQNTPAETSRAMLEQGQKIYSAIFKRIWRSMKLEFKKLYRLNAVFLGLNVRFGEVGKISREDYSVTSMSVLPVADPTITSEGARYARATMLSERAAMNPGYNTDAVERKLLEAMGIDEIDSLYPGTEGQEPTPDVKIQVQQMKSQIEQMKLEQAKMQFIMTMQETVRLNTAKIQELMASAASMEASANNAQAKLNVEAFRAGIEAIREQTKAQSNQLDIMMESMKNEQARNERTVPVIGAGSGGALSGMEGGPPNPTALQVGPEGEETPMGGLGVGVT